MKNIIFIDFENKQTVDLSCLNDQCEVIIFVGIQQDKNKIQRRIESKNKFIRVDYLKVDGYGKNALDFHIAFHLGRTYERFPRANCYILSGDHGFDPLIAHLHSIGMKCSRVESLSALPERLLSSPQETLPKCLRCLKSSTIKHNGGDWCTNCGRFATPPDPKITEKLVETPPSYQYKETFSSRCCNCQDLMDSGDGYYDDGEWTCWGCAGVDATN